MKCAISFLAIALFGVVAALPINNEENLVERKQALPMPHAFDFRDVKTEKREADLPFPHAFDFKREADLPMPHAFDFKREADLPMPHAFDFKREETEIAEDYVDNRNKYF